MKAPRVSINGDAYYTIRSFLMTAENALADKRRIYVWKPEEITALLESLQNDVEFLFPSNSDA